MKDLWMVCAEEVMAETHPDEDYYDLPEEQQRQVDDEAELRWIDRMASIADQGKECRKYGGGP